MVHTDVGLELSGEMWEVVLRMCDGENGLDVQVRRRWMVPMTPWSFSNTDGLVGWGGCSVVVSPSCVSCMRGWWL